MNSSSSRCLCAGVVAAMALTGSRVQARAPNLPIEVDSLYRPVGPVSVVLDRRANVRSLRAKSLVIADWQVLQEADSRDFVPVDNKSVSVSENEVAVDDLGRVAIPHPLSISLPAGSYCERLSISAVVDGYTFPVVAVKFAYFRVEPEGRVAPISSTDYERAVSVVTESFGPDRQARAAYQGRLTPIPVGAEHRPSGFAELIHSGDTTK